MMKLGYTKEELITRDTVVPKIAKVLRTEPHGKEIAIRTAQDIVAAYRKEGDEKLASEIERQLVREFKNVDWNFTPKA
ncbi:MAG TPA: hypothetical protein VMV00_00665 [Candidatus Baltobacteraceae bacterium]|nr:hypothetical protein [Candidatus Baltobacteraceae bacterium]